MILHLESGVSCPSGNGLLSVNYAVTNCIIWAKFFRSGAREAAQKRQFIHQLDYYPFFCHECDKGFDRLSALVMHLCGSDCATTIGRELIEHIHASLLYYLNPSVVL